MNPNQTRTVFILPSVSKLSCSSISSRTTDELVISRFVKAMIVGKFFMIALSIPKYISENVKIQTMTETYYLQLVVYAF